MVHFCELPHVLTNILLRGPRARHTKNDFLSTTFAASYVESPGSGAASFSPTTSETMSTLSVHTRGRLYDMLNMHASARTHGARHATCLSPKQAGVLTRQTSLLTAQNGTHRSQPPTAVATVQHSPCEAAALLVSRRCSSEAWPLLADHAARRQLRLSRAPREHP